MKIDNKEYWDAFYLKEDEAIRDKTRFAEFVLKNWTGDKKNILELGCGNGRDSLYFHANGLNVVGIDASEVAINNLSCLESGCTFICDDFIESGSLWKRNYDICYSRFTVHAINLEQEHKLIVNVYRALNDNGIFCVEVRSVHDFLYGEGERVGEDEFIFDEHYRRFIRINEFLQRLMKTGFVIKYAEENKGFAPFNGVDPQMIRVIAAKEGGGVER